MNFTERLKQLAAGATERPWIVELSDSLHDEENDCLIISAPDYCICEMQSPKSHEKPNAEFIVYLANNATAIAAAIEAAECLIDAFEGGQFNESVEMKNLRAALSQTSKGTEHEPVSTDSY